MYRMLFALFLALLSFTAQANPQEDADNSWVQGQPWPAHWGQLTFPWVEGWNVPMIAFVNKVYAQGEASSGRMRGIEYAQRQDATVEVCAAKKGVFNFATVCADALVDPDIIGTLAKGDIVTMLQGKGSTSVFGSGPQGDARKAPRVIQKITDAGDTSCWRTYGLVVKTPTSPECLQRMDPAVIGKALTRDFPVVTSAQSATAAN